MSRQFAILGLGFFGITVAQELHRQHDEVLGVDLDESRVDHYADLFSHAIVGDITDEQVISQLSLSEYDAVVIDTDDNLEASMICTLLVREHEARQVWVKAHSGTHYRLLKRLGADHVVYPEYDIGIRVGESLHYHAMVDFIDLGNRQFVVEIQTTEQLETSFPTVGDLNRNNESLSVIAIKRDSELIRTPGSDIALKPRDSLVLLGELEELRSLGRHL
ncbi:potassium channel family protein [Halomonas stenophila]|uniref:Trk system potassium uptake protein TrkA n=1 Tax=Halomonas stenophila TaxID=795312 RepID=A0A7W5HM61_9GAMM|nr:TrkA family potassium uptake protein [Halomonas stenophila]MBB3232437.1 trk system potassium uptake protein TrkA [Halomonas stenophila]